MKIFNNILLLFFLILYGCENEEFLNAELPYNEVLVVQSVLLSGSIFPGVLITKSLPLGVQFSIEAAEVKEVLLYLRVNSIRIIPLHYTSDGLYKPLTDFIVMAGDTYEIFGERNSQPFYAKTIIPFIPEVLSTNYNYSEGFVSASVKTNSKEVYAALWIINLNTPLVAEDFYNISIPDDISSATSIYVRSSILPEEYRNPTYNNKRYIQVYSFDFAFSEYFKTKVNGQNINNPYVQGSGFTTWNLQGKKTIGMFIGVAKSAILEVN